VRRSRRTVLLVVGLLAVSALFYAIDYAVFRSARDIGFYTLLDLAFIPINVLIVGLFINGLISSREREEMLHKMNMVVGAFFSEVGRDLIERLMSFDTDIDAVRPHMLFDAEWKPADYETHRAAVFGDHHPMAIARGDIDALRDLLVSRRSFLLGLLQNGNLLEHQTFTDMLWAVSHLAEELAARRDLHSLPASDARHIELDMARAYGRLLGESLLYTRHLRADYPYLYSFAIRTNPFDEDASVEVGE
jgi:hypothetical protein